MRTPEQEVIRCSACSCICFKPGRVRLRSCDRCGHGWVAHALQKLHPRRPLAPGGGPVEVALPGHVFELSSLILYGAQAVPIRLKILLDRLFSVLTPEQVRHILQALSWCLGDYVRGYMLQFPNGTALDCWSMVTPEEELLILKQFLRFGETRAIVDLMSVERRATSSTPVSFSTSAEIKGAPTRPLLTSPGPSSVPALKEAFPVGTLLQRPSRCHQAREEGEGRDDDPGSQPSRDPRTEWISQNTETDQGGPTGAQNLHAPPSCPPQRSQPSSSLCSLPPARRGRVSCDLCGKSFYDKGTLKIHHNAVHLKIKHGCTVAGCSMVFSSLRSRNRHSANPNPRLHTSVSVSRPHKEKAAWPGTAPASPAPSHQHTCHSCRDDQYSQSQAAPVLPAHRPSPPALPPAADPLPGSDHGVAEGRGRPGESSRQEAPTKKKRRKSSTPMKIEQEWEEREG